MFFSLEGPSLKDCRAPLSEVVFDLVGPGKGTGVGAKPFHLVGFDVVLELVELRALGGGEGGVRVDIEESPVEVFNVFGDWKVWMDGWNIVIVVVNLLSHVVVVVNLGLVEV